MLYAWAPLNAGGHTKKVTTTAVFFVAQCVGNVRLLDYIFVNDADAPLDRWASSLSAIHGS